jgi:hypothetical protein
MLTNRAEARDVFQVVAESWECAPIPFKLLFDPKLTDFEITDTVVASILSNEKHSQHMLEGFISYDVWNVPVTIGILKLVALNAEFEPKDLRVLLADTRRIRHGQQFLVTESILKLVISNRRTGPAILQIFLIFSVRVDCEVQITEDIMKMIASDTETGPEFIRVIIRHHMSQEEILTDDVLDLMIKNRLCGLQMIEWLPEARSLSSAQRHELEDVLMEWALREELS